MSMAVSNSVLSFMIVIIKWFICSDSSMLVVDSKKSKKLCALVICSNDACGSKREGCYQIYGMIVFAYSYTYSCIITE